MCGICGFVSLGGGVKRNENEKRAILKSMLSSMAYRGPDGSGIWIHPGDRKERISDLCFGHCRLSIIDLYTGAQPMSDAGGNIWITYNGEIYNYVELRKSLIAKGYTFKTQSDTEVIINLYLDKGKDCLKELNGMFAFCIWDKRKSRLFCARDRLGIKPFYYYLDINKFVFASEIKALHKFPGIKSAVNTEGVFEYSIFQYCLGDKTMFAGVLKLEPGFSLTLDIKSRKINLQRYWDIEPVSDARYSEEEFKEKLLFLLRDSVRIQLRSDVPLGTHLSGGLDSSIVACIASSFLPGKLKTFTGTFKQNGFDESRYALEVARRIKAKYIEIIPPVDKFINILPKLIYYLDEPVAGPGLLPQYYVSKVASQNVKVVLGGQGGDELFGGYVRYLIAYLEQSLKGAIFNVADRHKYVVTLKSIIPNLALLRNYKAMLQRFWKGGLFGPMDERYYRLVDRSDESQGIFSHDFILGRKENNTLVQFQKIFNRPKTPSYFNKMTYFDMKTLLPALLQVEDRTSMAVSLESRVPILDHRIVELANRIPPLIKFYGGESKHILKKAVKNIVPRIILERKDKMGFPVPLDYAKNPKLREFVISKLTSRKARSRGIFNSESIRKTVVTADRFDRAIWGAICLELWFEEFIDAK